MLEVILLALLSIGEGWLAAKVIPWSWRKKQSGGLKTLEETFVWAAGFVALVTVNLLFAYFVRLSTTVDEVRWMMIVITLSVFTLTFFMDWRRRRAQGLKS